MNLYELYIDGAITKNPGGLARYGYIIYHNKTELSRGNGLVGEGPAMSNNVAEHEALFQGLVGFIEKLNIVPWSEQKYDLTLVIYSDSKIVIRRLNDGRISGGLCRPYSEKIQWYIKKLKNLGITLRFKWIPREQNTEADRLSKKPVENKGNLGLDKIFCT